VGSFPKLGSVPSAQKTFFQGVSHGEKKTREESAGVRLGRDRESKEIGPRVKDSGFGFETARNIPG
jgi:hypothetical protein